MGLQHHMQAHIGEAIPNPVIDGCWHSGRGKLDKISYVGHHLTKGLLVRYRNHKEPEIFHVFKEWEGDSEYINPTEYQQRKLQAESKAKAAQDQASNSRRALLSKLQTIIAQSRKAYPEHPYVANKLIIPIGARQVMKQYQLVAATETTKAQYISTTDLLIPVYDYAGVLQGIQQITKNSKLARGTFKNGLMWLGGGLTTGEIHNLIYIVEGWATGVAVHMRTRNPVIVAFSTGNLVPVGQWARARYPESEIVYAVDNDIGSFITIRGQQIENPGKHYATEAAKAIGAAVITPPGNIKSDWCDWHVSQIAAEKKPSTRAA